MLEPGACFRDGLAQNCDNVRGKLLSTSEHAAFFSLTMAWTEISPDVATGAKVGLATL
jgi:hypothetical protein